MSQPPPTQSSIWSCTPATCAGARDFYAELCGWRPERIDAARRSYLALELGGGLGGGIVECATRRAAVAALRRGRRRSPRPPSGRAALGASVLLEPREGPAGWRSVVATPAAARSPSGSPSGSARRAGQRATATRAGGADR